MNKKVSIIIVSFNTSGILKDCLNNLKDSYDPLEVIVVDNASSDNSAQVVKEEFKWVDFIENSENVGLAHASNQGYNRATGDYILYLGSDAFPDPGTISGMVKYMEIHPKVGAATAQLVLRDGTLDMDAHRGFPTPWAALTHFSHLNKFFPKSRILNQYFLGHKDLDTPHEIDMCISHFLLVRRNAIDQINGWDEDYFVFGEDVDFCYRLKQAGWKIMYLPQWQATHYKGPGTGIRKTSADITTVSKDIKLLARRKQTEAMEIFYKKHYSNKYPKFVTAFVLAGIKILSKIRIMITR